MKPRRGDERLARGIERHQLAALGEAYDRYAPEGYGLALALLRNPAGAEALVESVFTDLWRGPRRCAPLRAQIVGSVAVRGLRWAP